MQAGSMNRERLKVMVLAAVLVVLAAAVTGFRVSCGDAGVLAGADIFDPAGLARPVTSALSVTLSLPVAMVVIAVFRNIVGLRTFGSFAPLLLALALRYDELPAGASVFAVSLAVGLIVRALLDRLRLMMIPRLGVMLTAVVLSVCGVIRVLAALDLIGRPEGAMFVMMVTTLLIERFHFSSIEAGVASAAKWLIGTVFVACCCLAVLRWRAVGLLLLRFPEFLLVVAAALLCIGTYRGYRLSELIRFRRMVEADAAGD